MPLTNQEIRVGEIAYFSVHIIASDTRVKIGTHVPRNGPFVCVAVTETEAAWAPLTSQFRKERLVLQPNWIENASGKMLGATNYLCDGASFYVGPRDAFIEATRLERPFEKNGRPRLNEAGIKAVLGEIERQAERQRISLPVSEAPSIPERRF